MIRLVQLVRNDLRRVAIAEGDRLLFLDSSIRSAYQLAFTALRENVPLKSLIEQVAGRESADYEAVYNGGDQWRLLPSFDHPDDPAHCLVSGTGLTHKASAGYRAAMHTVSEAQMTDSYRMFQLGLEGGNPPAGEIGVQPEWFYKGNGTILRAHREPLTIPGYGDDGGEEPEIAGAYIVSPSGEPVRVGFTVGNEFSDHKMEKKNYLYLAPSKLRECSIGPELSIGSVPFDNVEGHVAVYRNGEPLWRSDVRSGETNMAHSIANLEHHQFKYRAHRQPGDVHIHFYGADAFSFGAGMALEAGDTMEISFPQFGRPLQNSLVVEKPQTAPVVVRQL